MSYVFRLHNTGLTTLKGWESVTKIGTEDIKSIPDTLTTGNASKVGSSIPSPFARMYLFETAFQMLANAQNSEKSIYHQIVSDCLDFFQFLYMEADSGHLTFKKWEVDQRIGTLQNSAFEEHRNLGNTLELFFKGKNFKDTKEIYLIYYKKKLVGGTSPLTVLYTSPNWARIVKEEGWEFKTPAEDYLFDDDPCPIQERDEEFKTYIYRFIYAYNTQLGLQSLAFFDYFANARAKYPEISNLLAEKNLDPAYSETDLLNEYEKIDIDPDNATVAENLSSGTCMLLKPKDTPGVDLDSDFLMSPTVNYYKHHFDANNVKVTNNTPLVLVQGTHNLKYIDQKWDSSVTVNDLPMIPLEARKLPGFSKSYPYVTIGDFLEDTLIEMPFNLDGSKFFTGFAGDFKFLLPVKKTYFDFFTLDDLRRQLTILKRDNRVSVTLHIPVRHGSTIPLSKIYDLTNEEHVIKQKGVRGFNLGIFPFYKVVDNEDLNYYSVSLVSNLDDLGLNFYRFKDIKAGKKIDVEKKERTQGSGVLLSTSYYHIAGQSFDCIEAETGAVVKTRGLIIPQFTKEIQTGNALRDFKFAIDFGTSNTHIAYSDGNIETFDIGPEDRQMVLLSEEKKTARKVQEKMVNGAGNLAGSVDFFDNEFVPSYVGEGSNFSFPTRTSILQHASYVQGKGELFTNMNIGFNMEYDPQTVRFNEYHTNLKWDFKANKKGVAQERVELYFFEILWMIKNKILLNDGSLDTTIVWMVPFSMSRKMTGMFEDIWRSQVEKLFGNNNNVELIKKYESIVPYYAPQPSFRRGEDVVNIDIGGGTTDVLFFGRNNREYYSTSFRFAGNDLWGEGLAEDISQDNGFFQMLDRKINDKELILHDDQGLENVYEAFKGSNTLNSADICSLLFRHDDVFKFSEEIKAHPTLPIVLIFHLSSIVYHLYDVIEAKELPFPERFSFTGKGSSYLHLIGNQGLVQEFVNLLLQVFSGKDDLETVKVSVAENPKELTAMGAISDRAFNDRERIDQNVENLVHLGFRKTDASDPLNEEEVGDLSRLEPLAKDNFSLFLEKMRDRRIKKFVGKGGLELEIKPEEAADFLEKYAGRSFRNMKFTLEDEYDDDDEIDESLFFWFMKDALYELSKNLIER